MSSAVCFRTIGGQSSNIEKSQIQFCCYTYSYNTAGGKKYLHFSARNPIPTGETVSVWRYRFKQSEGFSFHVDGRTLTLEQDRLRTERFNPLPRNHVKGRRGREAIVRVKVAIASYSCRQAENLFAKTSTLELFYFFFRSFQQVFHFLTFQQSKDCFLKHKGTTEQKNPLGTAAASSFRSVERHTSHQV